MTTSPYTLTGADFPPLPRTLPTKAAERFFRQLLKGLQYAPRVVVTDKLKSYAAAYRTARDAAFPTWREVAGVAAAA